MSLPNVLISIFEILEFVKSTDCCPNVSITDRILLTITLTVAFVEISFSKLKLLKNYLLRLSMLQERSNDLTNSCIEYNMIENIDLEKIISDFASRNAHRNHFVRLFEN